MKKNIISMIIIVAVFSVSANIPLAYLGNLQGGAPSFEKEFEISLKRSLLSFENVTLADEKVTQSLYTKIGLEDNPPDQATLSRRIAETVTDSTVFIWTRIRGYSMDIERGRFMRAKISAQVQVELNIFGLYFKRYLYSGAIVCEAKKPKGWYFFSDPKKVKHISAAEQTDLLAQLNTQAVQRSSQIISTILFGEMKKIAMQSSQEDTVAEEIDRGPNLDDLFDLPSVEAPEVPPAAQEPE